jgi:hypothetical protein
VAGAIILPFQPSFAAILAIGVVPLIAYPYWRDARTFPSWWAGMSLLIFAAFAGAALLVKAALALAGVLAASRGPGWRILRGLCSAVWLYSGVVAALVLPHHPGSWGRIGGAAALLAGVGFGVAAWPGPQREVTASPHRALP